MDTRLVEFAEVLRQNGLRVSTAELQDAANALLQIGLDDLTMVKAALRATLCKREGDVETFDKAFAFFFSGAAHAFEALDASLLRRLEEQGLLEGDELVMVLATLRQLLPGLSELARAAVEGDRSRLARIFRAASLNLDLTRMETSLQTGFFSRRLLSGAGVDRARSDLQALVSELEARGVSAEGVEVVSKHLAAALRNVEEAARREIARQAKARVKQPGGGLAERSFHTLSRAEVEQTEAAVRRLAQKLKSRLIRKQRSRRRGSLHLHRTLRRSLSCGGVPMRPAFHARRPERPEVVVLCDVSDSVRTASRVMLLFTYTLQSLFARVRSFVFVSEIGEVTRHFRELEVDEAVDLATAGRAISIHSNSNYGRALVDFVRDHLGSVTRRTTVMIIGDGRNNYNPTNAWALEDLKRKCKRLLWICTEDRRAWGFGDSEMPRYARAVHQVVTVQTLADLSRVADQLVPV